VRELVQDRLRPSLALGVGDLGAEHVRLEEGDARRVLHGARVELGHEHLVVLLEGVLVIEHPLVEVEPLRGDLDDLVRVEVLGEGLAAIDAEIDAAVRAALHVVRPRDHCGDVGGQQQGRREGPVARLPLGRLLHRRRVGDHQPSGGGAHVEREDRLEVGLVEARVDAVGVERLEVGEEVHAAVDGVDEAVQADAGVLIRAARPYGQLVLGVEPVDLETVAVEGALR
jgi:hypothetical protein